MGKSIRFIGMFILLTSVALSMFFMVTVLAVVDLIESVLKLFKKKGETNE
jgi:hypothetical protein